MNAETIEKVSQVSIRLAALSALKEGFMEGQCFAQGVKQCLPTRAFSAICGHAAAQVQIEIDNLEAELEAL